MDAGFPPPSEEVYPNAPLRAVAIEVYFDGVIDAHSRLGPLQREYGFSHLAVPDQDDATRGLMLFGGKEEEPNHAIAIALNQFALVTYDYSEGHRGFSSWGTPVLQRALELLGSPDLTRVLYRYENLFQIDGADVDLERLFRIELARPKHAERIVRRPTLAWAWPWARGELQVTLGPASQPNHLLVSIGADATAGLDDLREAIDHVHRAARWTFEELITEELRTMLRKEGDPA